jgi:hypothetical protein
MSQRAIWTCDRCKAEAAARPGNIKPEGWTRGDIRFHDLPKMGGGQLLILIDLCEACQDELKRVWDEWLNPPMSIGDIDADSVAKRGPDGHVRVDPAAENETLREQRERFKDESYGRIIAERKQAELDRRRERIEEIAKSRGQPHERGKWPGPIVREPHQEQESRPLFQNFAPGDVVECVDASDLSDLREGGLYTVAECPSPGSWVTLQGEPDTLQGEPERMLTTARFKLYRAAPSVMPDPDSVMAASWPTVEYPWRRDSRPFLPGEAVECVNGGGGLTEGARYTVAKVHPVMMGSMPLIELADLRGAKFPLSRFRRVKDEETSP